MNYRIVELKFADNPEKTYYKPQRKRKGGIVSSVVDDEWEDYPGTLGGVYPTYEEALEIIKKHHVEVIQYHPVDL